MLSGKQGPGLRSGGFLNEPRMAGTMSLPKEEEDIWPVACCFTLGRSEGQRTRWVTQDRGPGRESPGHSLQKNTWAIWICSSALKQGSGPGGTGSCRASSWLALDTWTCQGLVLVFKHSHPVHAFVPRFTHSHAVFAENQPVPGVATCDKKRRGKAGIPSSPPLTVT